jgi:SOS-response transcriptional repressor LexA
MKHDDQQRPTWDGEAMAEALGHELACRDDADVWSFEPFLEWLGVEARADAERRIGDRDDDRLLRTGRALRARVLARRCNVALVHAPAPLRAPSRRATPAQVIDEALASGAAVRVNLAAAAGSGRELWDEPAEHWVALPAGVPRMRALAMRIVGESMAPLLHTGDTILVELGPSLARGRVVVARHPDDGYVCKRVERVGRREVLLASLDPSYGTVTIPRDDSLIVGTVRLAWRA